MTSKTFRFGVLAFDGCMLSSVTGPVGALYVAQTLANIRAPRDAPRFESVVFSARGARSVRGETGLELGGVKPLQKNPCFDLVLVPGIAHRHPREILDRDFAPELAALRALHARGTRIAATCSGTLLLAMSGLLDGHRATTSWWLAPAFRAHFPRVQLNEQSLIIDDGDNITTGASTSVYSLVLRMIEQGGSAELAQQVSRMMLLDAERQSQAPYISQAMLEKPRHSLSEKITHFLDQHLHNQISVSLVDECSRIPRSKNSCNSACRPLSINSRVTCGITLGDVPRMNSHARRCHRTRGACVARDGDRRRADDARPRADRARE